MSKLAETSARSFATLGERFDFLSTRIPIIIFVGSDGGGGVVSDTRILKLAPRSKRRVRRPIEMKFGETCKKGEGRGSAGELG